MTEMPDWDRVQAAIEKKNLEKADAKTRDMIEEAKNSPDLPDFIKEAIDQGHVIMPSEMAANPELDAISMMLKLRAQIDALEDSYETALKLLAAATRLYGVPMDEEDGYALFLPDSVGKSVPDCIDVRIRIDKEHHGVRAEVFKHDCGDAHPGVNLN